MARTKVMTAAKVAPPAKESAPVAEPVKELPDDGRGYIAYKDADDKQHVVSVAEYFARGL